MCLSRDGFRVRHATPMADRKWVAGGWLRIRELNIWLELRKAYLLSMPIITVLSMPRDHGTRYCNFYFIHNMIHSNR